MVEILQLNAISPMANEAFGDKYKLVKESQNPAGIILRSFKMHDYPIGDSVIGIARAGAGVNNIPVEKCSQRGIVVFNTPGANANAVKELVLCALLLGSRKIIPAIEWTKTLKGKGAEVGPLVEKGKSQFVGTEIGGKTLGVIGLGAIGAMVANDAVRLGMTVLGYDPFISIDAAWGLSRSIKKINSLEQLLSASDYVSLNVPYNEHTKHTINKDTVAQMKDGAVLVNCSRGELVDNVAVLEALKSGKLSRYITDFPYDELIGEENVICIPHLGASTPEAEDNCAVAAARELVDYLENGNIYNSVNFPDCSMPRSGKSRIAIIHLNIKDMINKITTAISGSNHNICNFVNKSRGEYAYSIIDIDESADTALENALRTIGGIVRVRVI